MKMMSYNIHHGVGLDDELNLNRIAAVIKNAGATIIGLQEVDRFYGERSNFQDQAKELATLLDYHYGYGANVEEPSQHPEFTTSQYGIAVLSKYPIISNEHLLLHSFGEEQRGVLKTAININEQTVHIYNTHLGLDSHSRQSQVNELIEMMNDDTQPHILLGDFNTGPDSQAITDLLQRTDLIDAFQHVQAAHSFPSDHPDQRIDYIFTSSSFTNKDQTVLHSQASDHLPIITTSHFNK